MAKGKYEYWLTDEGLLLLAAWTRDGLTDEQVAHNMGVSLTSLKTYKQKYPTILAALKKGKEIVDIEVENTLNKKALGFKETIKKPMKLKTVYYNNGKREKEEETVQMVEEEIYIPPDVTAQIFWLKNRKPEQWREKRIHDDAPDNSTINDGIIAIAELIRNPRTNRDFPETEGADDI